MKGWGCGGVWDALKLQVKLQDCCWLKPLPPLRDERRGMDHKAAAQQLQPEPGFLNNVSSNGFILR